MGDFVKVGKVGDFHEGRGTAVRIDGKRVAVFRQGQRLYAMQDACPHMGASLADYGRVDGGRVECHWHHWTFDLSTGGCDQRGWARARIYEVKVDGEDVYLRPPDPAPAPPAAGDDGDDWVVWNDDFLKS